MNQISEILGLPLERLEELEKIMSERGFEPALEKVGTENNELIQRALGDLGLGDKALAEEVYEALARKAEEGDNELYSFMGIDRNNFDFHKVADVAREITTENEGFFLKKEYGARILREREPEALLDYLGYESVDELLKKEDITDIFSALRFIESQEWMHKTFDVAYTKFTADDFERRPIEIKVLGPQWEEVAKKYVAKKHHNVSHLKEFGVIFLNPIAQSGKGKFVRDFALLLHYFHEIAFYSKLFEQYAHTDDFNQKFISLLRGDVKEASDAKAGDWLLIQRYLWKEDPNDPRLSMPHVNPEAMHWRKAEQDLVAFGKKHEQIHLEFWDQFWSVAGQFKNSKGENELISFDLEDNAMMVAHKAEGKEMKLVYHQQEALWNRIFATYVEGYDKLEEYVIRDMEKGLIRLNG